LVWFFWGAEDRTVQRKDDIFGGGKTGLEDVSQKKGQGLRSSRNDHGTHQRKEQNAPAKEQTFGKGQSRISNL